LLHGENEKAQPQDFSKKPLPLGIFSAYLRMIFTKSGITHIRNYFAELKKLKIIQINQNKPFLSELSKKQKVIFDAFGIREEVLHSY